MQDTTRHAIGKTLATAALGEADVEVDNGAADVVGGEGGVVNVDGASVATMV
jgi:hypothetical protein